MASSCLRSWWLFERVGIPQTNTIHFRYGTAYHAVVERHLKGEPKFPKGWYEQKDGKISRKHADEIKELFIHALDGKLIPAAGYPADHPHKIEWDVGPFEWSDPSLKHMVGQVDLAHFEPINGWRWPSVEDHKTTGSWDWAKTPTELAADLQGIPYARALWLELGAKHEYIGMRHNTVLKKTQYNGAQQRLGRAKIINVPQPGLHITDIEKGWSKMEETVVLMQRYESETNVAKVPGTYSSCDKFGGCQHKAVCKLKTTLGQYYDGSKKEAAQEGIEGRKRDFGAKKGKHAKLFGG